MADTCADLGLDVPEWRGEWHARMAGLIPAYGSASNPVDVTATLISQPRLLRDVLALCVEHPETDIVAVTIGNVIRGEEQLVDAIVAAHPRTSKPILVTWVGGSSRPALLLAAEGVPIYPDPSRALRAAKAMAAYTCRRDLELAASGAADVSERSERARALVTSVRWGPSLALDEHESKALLSTCGIATVPERVAGRWGRRWRLRIASGIPWRLN
jgi:acyl-CoA synthetase (NDP forming)